MSQIKRRIPIHNILLQTLVLFVILGPAMCGCDNEPNNEPGTETDFSGRWEGSTITDDPNQSIAVDLTRESNGDYIFHYGAPHNFKLFAEKVRVDDSTMRLRIKKASGGKGDSLTGGTIILTMRDKNHMDARIQHEGANWDDKAELEKKG